MYLLNLHRYFWILKIVKKSSRKRRLFYFQYIWIMAKAVKKKRQSKYDEKLSIKGTFKDVFRVVKKNKENKQAKKS